MAALHPLKPRACTSALVTESGNQRGVRSVEGGPLQSSFPQDESINDWSRLLTIQFIEQKGVSPLVVMDQLRSAMQSRCPDSPWQVIQQDPTSVLYEWSIAHCGNNPDEH